MSKPTVAILGASNDRTKYGNKAVRAYQRQGYDVYPVNPRLDQIEGLTAYPTLDSVPVERLDRISVYLPPPVTEQLLPQMAAKGCEELWLNPGSATAAIAERARSLGLPVIEACSIVDIGEIPDAD